MDPVATGKRAAPRHAGPARVEGAEGGAPGPSRGSQTGPLLLLALGITAAVVAWGYLVFLAIDGWYLVVKSLLAGAM
jgi:hypothetical protein